jgi:hypothetical protein
MTGPKVVIKHRLNPAFMDESPVELSDLWNKDAATRFSSVRELTMCQAG